MADSAEVGGTVTRPIAPPFPWKVWAIGAVVVGLLWWSANDTKVSLGAIIEGGPEIVGYFKRLLPSAETPWPLDYLKEITARLLETIKIALGASIIGSALSLPFALLGARNLAPGRAVYAMGRVFLNLLRTVPDLVLAALLASVFGIGPLAGIMALTIFTFGIVAKLLCDKIETLDPGPMEAIAATGATRLERAIYATLPDVGPDYAAYALYAFEVNVRTAAVLGLVGAGGIGMILQRDLSFLNYAHVGMIIGVTFVVVLIIDTFSTWLRSKLV